MLYAGFWRAQPQDNNIRDVFYKKCSVNEAVCCVSEGQD